MQSGFSNKLFINSQGFFAVTFTRIAAVYRYKMSCAYNRRLTNLKVLHGRNVYFRGVPLIALVADFLESQCFIGAVTLEIDSQGADRGPVHVVRESQTSFMYCNKSIGCMYIYMYMSVECKSNEYMYTYNQFSLKISYYEKKTMQNETFFRYQVLHWFIPELNLTISLLRIALSPSERGAEASMYM